MANSSNITMAQIHDMDVESITLQELCAAVSHGPIAEFMPQIIKTVLKVKEWPMECFFK